MTEQTGPDSFVTVSGIAVPEVGTAALEVAMRNRIGLVEGEPGFQRLEVWRPVRAGDPYRMVTWWDDPGAFQQYMRSPAHDASHGRMPGGPHRPRPAGLDRYWRIAQ